MNNVDISAKLEKAATKNNPFRCLFFFSIRIFFRSLDDLCMEEKIGLETMMVVLVVVGLVVVVIVVVVVVVWFAKPLL